MKYTLIGEPQCLPAGYKQTNFGSISKNAIGDLRGLFDEMLAAIKEKESLSTA